MEVREINLTSNTGFMSEYISGRKVNEDFFDYSYSDTDKYKKRVDNILTRTYKRNEVADYLTSVHSSLDYEDRAHVQIEKLRKPNSMVVVGGQQAGLLTGPLYTVYKAMSIIILAKQQEEKLNLPVIPIFWIAGEDHDVDEIRFVYKKKIGRWKKHLYHDNIPIASASSLSLDSAEIEKWLQEIFATLPETAYTKSLLDKVTFFSSQSTTFVDFFRKVMNWFFGKEGLLLLDAHDPAIRKLEVDYFMRLIRDVECVQSAQQEGAHAFLKAGYGEPIVTDDKNAHLFFEINGERKRLDYQEGVFSVKGIDVTYTKEELTNILTKNPERFSNNVVTRPLMQEWLLPVLSFVSGPGELLYWATLKEVFAHFNVKMPPVIPRIQLTFIPRHIGKWLVEMNYDIKPFLQGEMEEVCEAWLEEATSFPVSEVIDKVRNELASNHYPIRQLAEEMDPTLAKLGEKNLAIMNDQINFMEKKMKHFVRQSHEHTLSKFTETGHWLTPLNRAQERIIHPIMLMNVIGEDGFRRLLSMEMSVSDKHKIVYL
ncbi:bacillithiol biosynthesis cysteine-adding enzyme BshC [Halalkalibacter lacteus]|uniref:bacillithiol biosynthesis cysteine-adding enzyme BshC n=1 Tax=Halalkalibacter lacteus TaxID=3090663 RepID=UPI002FC7E53D